ncbi:DMT family transporter [Desulfosarcina ovata]|nr:DMT family transporter [Desulfosarcina ovata]
MMAQDAMQPTISAAWKTTLGAMMISFSAVWVKLVHVSPTASAYYRVFLGGIFLLLILVIRGEPLWRGWRTFSWSLVAGLFFALDLYSWHRCIGYVGPGLATILGNFEVFLVPVAGVLLYGERLSWRFVLSVPLAVTGLFMIVGIRWEQLSPNYRIGIAYGLSTALFYTGFLVVLRRLQTHGSRPSALFSLMVVSFFTAFFLAVEMLRTGDSFAVPDLQSGVALIALGLFSQTVGWLLITHSLPLIPAAIAGLLLLLQPSLSFLWDVLFFGRETSTLAWAGVSLALSAIYIGATSGRRRSAKR